MNPFLVSLSGAIIDPKAASGTLGPDFPSDARATRGREAETATGADLGAAARGSEATPPEPAKLDAASCRTARDFERLLRSIGFSRAAAKRLAAGGWSALGSDEPGDDVAALAEAVRSLAQVVRDRNEL